MFKSWNKKSKIKAVFKLQFHATQIPKMKKSAVMISLVPDDVGKPTVKLEKAAIQDGTCSWENPIFESVKFVRDSKSGNLREKIYHFVVSTGSSKSGFLGEASIDFADFAAEINPVTVSIPLKFANSGAILHVTIQNVEGYADQRNDENSGVWGLSKDGSLNHQLSSCSTDENYDNVEDGQPAKARSGSTEQNASFKASTGTSSADASATAKHVSRSSNTNLSVSTASDGSLGQWTSSLEDNHPRERLQVPSDNASEKLKNEIASLMRQIEVSELELQSLRRQVAKESSRGQNMSRQILSLTEERDLLKNKYEQLKSQQNLNNETESSKTLQYEIKNARLQLETIKEELVYEKELNNNLQLQLQKTQNSNAELLLAVQDLEAMVEEKNAQLLDQSTNRKSQNKKVGKKNFCKEMNGDEHRSSFSAPAEPNDDPIEVGFLKRKIADLNREIDIQNKHVEELNEHIKELSLDYELLEKENLDISLRLKQEEAQQIMLRNEHSASLAKIEQLESQVERLEEKMKQQTDEYRDSLDYIDELEDQVKSFKKELAIQAEKFENDLSAMKCAEIKQERANLAEEALRKTRQSNAITSDRFQQEYGMLSVEMTSKVKENEKNTMKALAEADELRQQNNLLEGMLQKCNQDLRHITDQNELKLQELTSQIDLKEKTIEHMSHELENKSNQLEDAQRHQNEKDEAFFMQIQMLGSEIKKLMAGECKLSKPKLTEHMTEFVIQKGKEITLGGLLSEVRFFKIQYNELKHSLHKEQVEKENLKEKMSQLQGELKKKEAEFTSMEKNLKNSRGRTAVTYVNLNSIDHDSAATPCSMNTHNRKSKSEMPKGSYVATTTVSKSQDGGTGRKSAQNKVFLAPKRSELQTRSVNELAVSNNNHGIEHNTDEVLTEIAALREKNKSMEKELKEMQERYLEVSLKFAEVENERQQLVMALRKYDKH